MDKEELISCQLREGKDRGVRCLMMKIGLAGLGLSACLALLLAILSTVGWVQIGPCGPDLLGLFLLLGFFLTGAVGLLITTAGLARMGIRKFRHLAENDSN